MIKNQDSLFLTPIALLIFNRPDLTKIVFERVRQIKPKKLLVIADGPRKDKQGEAEKCAATRDIIEQVDWDCIILKNYSDVNLGCGIRVSTGISWIFENVNEAIILEDDCLPNLTFFQFCNELLEKYREDERVMMISGSNILQEWKSNIQSYHFSNYGSIWGWATWKRAWQHYDYHMKLWEHPEVKNLIQNFIISNNENVEQRIDILSKTFRGEVNTWDYQWTFARWIQSGMSIVPAINLISNIGFREDATHTMDFQNSLANLPINPMLFPLKETLGLIVDREFDKKYLEFIYQQKSKYQKVSRVVFLRKIKQLKKLSILLKYLK